MSATAVRTAPPRCNPQMIDAGINVYRGHEWLCVATTQYAALEITAALNGRDDMIAGMANLMTERNHLTAERDALRAERDRLLAENAALRGSASA
jgi:hypothetical protein